MKATKLNLVKKTSDKSAKVTIRKLPTGVRGLDEILGAAFRNSRST
jgi:hypothetical protein